MTAILPTNTNTAFQQLRLQHCHRSTPPRVAPTSRGNAKAKSTSTSPLAVAELPNKANNSNKNNKAIIMMMSSTKKVGADKKKQSQNYHHVKFQDDDDEVAITTTKPVVDDDDDDVFSLHNHKNSLQRSLIVPSSPFLPPLALPKPILKKNPATMDNGTNDTVSTTASTAFDEDIVATTTTTAAANTCSNTTAPASSATLVAPTCRKQRKRHVQFDLVHVREYPIVMGDNPACTYGAPIMLDWGFEDGDEHEHDDKKHDILYYETIKSHHTNPRHFLLNSYQRRDLLRRSGYSDEQIQLATRQTAKVQRQREWNKLLLPFFRIQEAYIVVVEKCCRRSRSTSSSTSRPRRREQRKQQNKKGTRTAGR